MKLLNAFRKSFSTKKIFIIEILKLPITSLNVNQKKNSEKGNNKKKSPTEIPCKTVLTLHNFNRICVWIEFNWNEIKKN